MPYPADLIAIGTVISSEGLSNSVWLELFIGGLIWATSSEGLTT